MLIVDVNSTEEMARFVRFVRIAMYVTAADQYSIQNEVTSTLETHVFILPLHKTPIFCTVRYIVILVFDGSDHVKFFF